MECPHCKYTTEEDWDEYSDYGNRAGEKGDFYKFPVLIERKDTLDMYDDADIEREYVYACPSCKKLFIDP